MSVLPSLYPALSRFQHAMQFNCKPVASYLLSGRGKHGRGRNCRQTPQEYVDTHNLSFFHPRTVIRNSPPGHLTSGVIKEDVELCIQMCVDKEGLSIQSQNLLGYLCCLSTDEMALKPALEYSPTHRSIVGLAEPQHLRYEDITELCESHNEDILTFLQTHQFVTQAREVRVASLDDKVNFPIGVFYCGSKGGANYIEELYHKILGVAQRCSSCLQSDVECIFHCDDCYAKKLCAIIAPQLVKLPGTHFFDLVTCVSEMINFAQDCRLWFGVQFATQSRKVL